MKSIHERLSGRLDDFASGYPSTGSGIEIRILQQLFSEEEARLFLTLSPLLESARDVAGRLGQDPEQTAALMEHMATRGLLFRSRRGDAVRYCPMPFVPGIYDFQLKTMDREFARQVEDYTDQGLGRSIQANSAPVMRTIPVNRQLVAQWPIAPYEDALEIIESQQVVAVADCICRTKSALLGKSCGKPLETCLLFGSQADYYVENRMGRRIDREEARQIVKACDAAGLVLQPFNARNIGVMCCCCGDCCEMLGSLKRQPSPAAAVKSNYFAELDAEACSNCGICTDRCQMEAVSLTGDAHVIDLNRCIGCGLCVTTCPEKALALVRKDENRLYRPPRSGSELFMALSGERGKTVF